MVQAQEELVYDNGAVNCSYKSDFVVELGMVTSRIWLCCLYRRNVLSRILIMSKWNQAGCTSGYRAWRKIP